MKPAPDFLILQSAMDAVVEARHGDPFAVLGPHEVEGGIVIRAFLPGAMSVEVVETATGEAIGALERRHPAGFFEGVLADRPAWLAYRLRATSFEGVVWETEDPYRFGPVLGPLDDYLLGEGTHRRLWEKLGAHLIEHEGVRGVHFAVWAPNADRIAVVGEFNDWDGRRHPMRRRLGAGVFELFVPGVGEGALYKYEIRGPDGNLLPLKADPVGFGAEYRPGTASRVSKVDAFAWADADWMTRRAALHNVQAPISVYEVHLGSWARGEDNRFLTYEELGDRLIPYAIEMGFTHLELLPITEHPFDGSWGYQPLGLFAPTSRFGSPAEFARFVDRCHQAGLGLILDWVPGHFPTDAHGLGRFDGTALYEHADPRQGFHQDWNTLIYNFGRAEVINYLHANALFWLDNYHLDGLRVDAVASMLYLDYSRKHDEWVPNKYGGNENLEAVDFMRRMNELAYGENPGVMTVAEESTSWPGVSKPTWTGGLGFGFKWNMGWMNDTLDYISKDPVHRRWHHHQMTFGLLYAFSENFILPISHDEVVHGKGSLLTRMPGDTWQKFANLRAYFGFMWGHPGKKLLFMGQEFAQGAEWSEARSLDWHQLDIDLHKGVQDLVRDLNHLYRETPSLHRHDCHGEGFQWIDASDSEHSVYAFLRLGDADHPPVMVVCNFTPNPHVNYRIGLPQPGRWREVLNTDAACYRGSGMGNAGGIDSEPTSWHGRPCSAQVTLPPLSTLFFVAEGVQES
ncbi:1,4-alpha-glucan branching protein GlgB [Geminicoccus roseus]|uniref:1,4-alpha-glucan branching protein GlgB n=1 Tax=Geminicoccus roseus TaxID=404900 RepID=UPI00041D6C21|nr:1,4-alpha-glucan branching protein GlgB [Geminicoccus roseus]